MPPAGGDVLVKLEFYNPTGSYKDRMALAMIEGAEARGALRPGMRVVEFTGGSTGSSLAMVCAVKGYRCVLLSSDAFAEEKLRTMRAFGAELRIVPSDGGKVTPALFERFRREIAVLAAEPDTFWTDQFHNTTRSTATPASGGSCWSRPVGRLDVFCGAVGTGGMLAGVARALREAVHGPDRGAGAGEFAGDDRGPRRRAPSRGHRDRPHSAAHDAQAARRGPGDREDDAARDGAQAGDGRRAAASGRRAP